MTSQTARRLAASAAVVGALSLLSKVLGYGREAALAAAFGASGASDAYFVALVLPTVIAGLVGEVLATATLPVFTEHVTRDPRRPEFATLLWSTFHLALAAAALLLAVGVAFAEPLAALVAPGLPPETRELAARLTRLVVPAALFVAGAYWATAVLHAHQHFLTPAAIGIPYNVVVIAAALAAASRGDVTWVAWATVLAAATQLAIQLPPLARRLPPYRPVLDRRHPDLARIGRLAAPILVGMGAGTVNLVVDRLLASGLGEGTVSVLNYAARAAWVPFGLLALPVITVLYPTLAARAARPDPAGTRAALRRGLAALALVTAPATVLLALLSEDAVRFLFQRGAFTAADTARTAPVLLGYALGLPFLAWRDYLSRTCYALQDARSPVRAGLLAVAVNIALNLLLVRRFGAPALAVATSLATAVQCAVLAAALRGRLGGLGGRQLLAEGARIAAATLPLAAAVLAADRWLLGPVGPRWEAYLAGLGVGPALRDLAGSGLRLAALGTAGLAAYALACRALRVEAFGVVEDLLRHLIGRLRTRRAPA